MFQPEDESLRWRWRVPKGKIVGLPLGLWLPSVMRTLVAFPLYSDKGGAPWKSGVVSNKLSLFRKDFRPLPGMRATRQTDFVRDLNGMSY